MEQNLPFESVYGAMEKHAIRISFEALNGSEYKLPYEILKGFYGQEQAYEELHIITHQSEKVDWNFVYFVKWHEELKCYMPIIFQKKDIYKPVEYLTLFKMAKIPAEYIESMDYMAT